MNYLEYLQIFGVFLGFCQMIPSIYKNFKTRNNPIETRAINQLSYSTAILMVYGTLARLPNLVKGLKDGLISKNSVNIRRAILILLGSTFTLITFYVSLVLMAFYYDTSTEKQETEKHRIRIGAGIFTIALCIIIYYLFYVVYNYT